MNQSFEFKLLECIRDFTSNHVLDKVRVAGTVRVRVVPILGGVLDVRHVDGDPPVPLLGGVVDGGVVPELGQLPRPRGEHLGGEVDYVRGRGQGPGGKKGRSGCNV